MSTKALALALMCMPFLAACDDIELKRGIALLTGKLDSLTDQHKELQDRIAALSADDDADKAELDALRQELAQLALQLSSVGYEPSSEPSQPVSEASSEPPAPIGPAYNTFGYTGPEPCPGSVFRILTCEGSEWHWLGPNMEWVT